jgi:flagellar biogenesis protein FliO
MTLLLAAIAVVLRLRARGTGQGRTMKITSRAAIGRGTSLLVVEVEGRRLLVGAAANQMNLLAELGTVGIVDIVDIVDADGQAGNEPVHGWQPVTTTAIAAPAAFDNPPQRATAPWS